MEPDQYGTLTLHMETPATQGTYTYNLRVHHNEQDIVIESGSLRLVPPPSIDINVQLGWRTDNSSSNATVLIYDQLTLLHKVPGVAFKAGNAVIRDLHNVIPGNKYRIVVLVPYYLPQQHIVTLKSETTNVRIPRLYPLDYNQDGELSLKDVVAVVKMQPNFITSLFIGP